MKKIFCIVVVNNILISDFQSFDIWTKRSSCFEESDPEVFTQFPQK